jgi:hypothetical protein
MMGHYTTRANDLKPSLIYSINYLLIIVGWQRLGVPMGSRTIVQPESLEDFTSVF